MARNFTREEIEKLKGWEPPDIAPPSCQSMQVVGGRKLLKAIEAHLGWEFDECPRCGSCQIEEVLTPEGCHYAKLVCTECARFLRWLPSPEAEAKRRALYDRVLTVLPHALPGWDLNFVSNIATGLATGRVKSLSPKQLAQLERIEREVSQ